jgi:uncharacterized membrane protein
MISQQRTTIQAAMDSARNPAQRLADKMTRYFGTPSFLLFHVLFFAVWIAINEDWIPGVHHFDPFPFSFLTMVVSLEAIFLSIIVLMSQNRASDIANLREEMNFQVSVRAEQEVTRLVQMVDDIHDHLQLGKGAEDDDELRAMKERTDIRAIEQNILNELRG